jgi:hypothetical protein
MKIGYIYDYEEFFENFLEYVIEFDEKQDRIRTRSIQRMIDEGYKSYLNNSKFYTDIFEEE